MPWFLFWRDNPLVSVGRIKAQFLEPMECLPVSNLPEGAMWTWEIKLDGWRMEVVKTGGRVTLYSRRGKNFNAQFGYIARELAYLPDDTVIDGEVVAVDEEGRPSFNLLQNFRSEESRIVYYVFDIPIHNGTDLMRQPLSQRREVLRSIIRAEGHLGVSEASHRPLAEMLKFTQTHGLEGIVAKRADSAYQPGLRTGAWSKHRFNRSQEFVIGGYVPSDLGIDSLIVGVYRDKKLYYVARVRAGFNPASRQWAFAAIRHLTTSKCPFVNLPQKEPGRWGVGLTAEKMKECVWLKPDAVAEIEFLEWTGEDHLRHTKFIRLRDDKNPRQVVRET
jgi:bifunctional non-homologous end joining protein LigD